VQVLILEQVYGKFNKMKMIREIESQIFLSQLILEIEQADSLHSKKLKKNLDQLLKDHKHEFNELLNLISQYFNSLNLTPSSIAKDYLRMVNDMRKEGVYFLKHGQYSCKNQSMAYNKVYSNKDIMSYYMNALLISQILWSHHFSMFIYFKKNLKNYFEKNAEINILDVGPGHGFFSYIVKTKFPRYNKLDIVDISESSLLVTERIIGHNEQRTAYHNADIFNFNSSNKYDLVLLGEVLEHLDNPLAILDKLSNMLSDNGLLWLTTPTNAPALDHVFLFSTKQEILDLVGLSKLEVIDSYGCYAEDLDEETAIKNKVTCLIGAFCKKR
jgi:2-polyprenyl-3-methyl-5-hydroxy-6-metoxy-1,4-benzoquinol methylase